MQDDQNTIFETARLSVARFRPEDVAVLTEFGVPHIARMMTTLTVPWPEEVVSTWITSAIFRGKPGFRAGIYAGEVLVGFVGLGGDPASVAYALHPDHQGRGYGSEALKGLVRFAFQELSLDSLQADHYEDNPASGHVLRKSGFEFTHEAMMASAGRLEPARSVFYRLTRAQFLAQAQKAALS